MMPIDDELLANIHQLIEQVGEGTSQTLLELFGRIIAAETLAVQLHDQVERDRSERAASEAQLRAGLKEIKQIVWGILAILAVIVLILVIATIAQMVRGR
jgi:hypothetical protein